MSTKPTRPASVSETPRTSSGAALPRTRNRAFGRTWSASGRSAANSSGWRWISSMTTRPVRERGPFRAATTARGRSRSPGRNSATAGCRQLAGERGFAALARPEQCAHRIGGECRLYVREVMRASDHVHTVPCNSEPIPQKCKDIWRRACLSPHRADRSDPLPRVSPRKVLLGGENGHLESFPQVKVLVRCVDGRPPPALPRHRRACRRGIASPQSVLLRATRVIE